MGEIVKLIQKYFPPEQWDNALRVAKGESGLRPDATNKNKDRSIDYGLFQINSIHAKNIMQEFGYTMEDLRNDVEKNIQVAKWIYDRNKGWRPWVAAQNMGLDKVPYTPSTTNAQPTYNEKLTNTDYTGKTWKYNTQTQKYDQMGTTPTPTPITYTGQIPGQPPPKNENFWDRLFNPVQNLFSQAVPQAYAQTNYPNAYTVKAGDTLWDIAQKYLGSGSLYPKLQGYTGDPRQLPIGTRLTIPTSSQPAPNTSTRQGSVYTPPPQTNYTPAPRPVSSYNLPQGQAVAKQYTQPTTSQGIKFDFRPAQVSGQSAYFR